MKLIDALGIIRQGRSAAGETLKVFLGCGFEPLHLKTFLAAHLQKRFPSRRVDLVTGVYGDLAGNLERAGGGPGAAPASVGQGAGFEAVAIVIEWSDLDPRLGVRAVGGWTPETLPDIVRTAERAAARLRVAIERLAERGLVALCPPSVPLPPIAFTPGTQASAVEMDLRAIVAALTGWAVRHPRIRVVRTQRLDDVSPPNQRLDVAGEMRLGFPCRQAHADAVAELLAALIAGPTPKKGLITDLDDTLWRGLLGDAGVDGLTWQLGDVPFPKGEAAAVWATLKRLRDLFGKTAISEEDRLRLPSIRAIAVADEVTDSGDVEEYQRWLASRLFVVVPIVVVALSALHSRPRLAMAFATVMNVGIALCIHRAVLHANGPVGRVLNSAPFVWVGLLSYSIYLWQQLFLNRASSSPVTAFPLNIALVFAAACLSYYLIERPSLRYRQTLEAKLFGRRRAAPVGAITERAS